MTLRKRERFGENQEYGEMVNLMMRKNKKINIKETTINGTKIKGIINDKIIAFDFNVDLLKTQVLFEICKALDLNNIYIDIYGVDVIKCDFSEKLLEYNNALTISRMIKTANSFSIKATIDDIPSIVKVLSEFQFDELNVWDAYTDWEQYLKNKEIFYQGPIFKLISKLKDSEPEPEADLKQDSESGVYINYNRTEGNQVEMYFDPNNNVERIRSKLVEIIRDCK